MKTLSQAIIMEKNRLASKAAYLILLKVSLPDGTNLYLINNTEDLVYNGQVYTAMPFDIEAVKSSAKGEIPTVNLKISNITRIMQYYLEKTAGGVGSEVTLIVVRTPQTDEFELSQDFKSGGDGAKLYNWNAVNMAQAAGLDSNMTSAGFLNIDCGLSESYWSASDFSAPFLYKSINGDFDIEAHIQSITVLPTSGYAVIAVRDPNASTGEDAVWMGVRADGYFYSRNIVNSVNTALYSASGLSAEKFLRIKRAGAVFTFYSKSDINGSWTQRASATRSDFSQSIQAGIGAIQNNASGDLTVFFNSLTLNKNILDESSSELTMGFDVLATQADSQWCTFTLGAPNPMRRRFPLHRYIAFHCNWQFKSAECGYPGGDTTCNRNLDACRGKSNSKRFGGYPGLGSRSVRVV
ncbi:MAG: hypothetical protein AABZ23_02025 [Deltaproteobacteria bacterium]